MKRCFKCGKPKELTEFYAHPQMADGHLGKCKDCAKADVKLNYKTNRPHYVVYDRARAQTSERKQRAEIYAKTHVEICNALKRSWEKRNPEKKYAIVTLNNAVRDGKVIRVTMCEVCKGTKNVEAHHADYSKPLTVRWLCKKHHWAADVVRRTKGMHS